MILTIFAMFKQYDTFTNYTSTMKKIILLALAISMLPFVSEAKRKQTKKRTITKKAVVVNQENEMAQIVVKFISVGTGIDAKGLAELEEMIKQFKSEQGYELKYSIQPWGREGERNYCFSGNKTEMINLFFAQLQETFQGNRRIFLKQNEKCLPNS
jgi:hypothetical protein